MTYGYFDDRSKAVSMSFTIKTFPIKVDKSLSIEGSEVLTYFSSFSTFFSFTSTMFDLTWSTNSRAKIVTLPPLIS